jgi:acetoacetyl-CoA synthetase
MSPHRTPLWQHCESDQTNVAKFITYVNEQLGLSLKTYDDLYSWSVGDATFQDFWRAAYQWLELAPPGSKPVGPMLADEVRR